MTFKKGTIMSWKGTGDPAWEKETDDDWAWWYSLNQDQINKPKEPPPPKEGEKPPQRRLGFKWTDNQVYEYYRGFMDFQE